MTHEDLADKILDMAEADRGLVRSKLIALIADWEDRNRVKAYGLRFVGPDDSAKNIMSADHRFQSYQPDDELKVTCEMPTDLASYAADVYDRFKGYGK
jgi:hypothetical protein